MGDVDLMSRLRALADEQRTGTDPGNGGDLAPLEAAQQRIANLEVAVEHQRVIGQATGMVMERFGLDVDTALGVLRRISQEHNRKLHDIATELVQQRHAEGL